jgi:hypothetical protein
MAGVMVYPTASSKGETRGFYFSIEVFAFAA